MTLHSQRRHASPICMQPHCARLSIPYSWRNEAYRCKVSLGHRFLTLFMCIFHNACLDQLQGRARFQLYQKLLALAAAVVQAVGQLTYIRPFVADWDVTWLACNSLTLVAGAMVLIYVRPMSSALQDMHSIWLTSACPARALACVSGPSPQ